jgi:hypothetical protein
MRAIVSAAIGALLVVTGLAAQSHDNQQERKASDEINFATALRVGAETLPAGDYRVVCDRSKVVFTRTLDGKRFEVPCQGVALDKKSDQTKAVTVADKDGGRALKTLLLRGGNVEHSFH